jgi:chaperonin GroEL
LASGIAVIRVGAPTQVEMIEKKHRIEDALEAVNSAQLGGIHAGGGVPLARASKTVQPGDLSEEQKLGFEIVLRAIKEPIRQMAANAGLSPDLIADKVGDLEGNEGYDFAEEKVTDMLEAGIVDPVRVTTSALRNAVSVASILLTTNYAIVETE